MTDISTPTLVTSAIGLLTITNPIGSLPIFLNLTKGYEPARQKRLGLLVGLAVFAVLTVSLIAGSFVLQAFGIDLTSFRIAGNLLVATIGWAMLTAKTNIVTVTDAESPVVVPLAIPVIAGPGAISLIITFQETYSSLFDYGMGILMILVISAIIAVALYFAPQVARIVKPTGMSIVTRIFGLLLLAIAVQSILSALSDAFPVLTK
ncbi:MarC family protein [Herbiconiux sp. 11R-BC]|uniref:MarC family protein n=1 Tax=Herbiconiux sp. 11R-BC TaxID=3111637 RepID=UPI003BFB174E